MTNTINKNIEAEKKFFTQKELAKRWNVSEGTIINWRNRGILYFLRFPESVRILYPVDKIFEHEQLNIVTNQEEFVVGDLQKKSKRKQPVISAEPNKDWRI